MSAGLVAHESGDTLLRLSPTLVQPNDSSSDLIADKLGNLTSALGSRTGVEANSNTQAGITGVNMMDDHWGLSCWLPPLTGMGLQPGQRTVWSYIPSAKRSRYPPTVSMQFFPNATENAWQPFIGVGVNCTGFFDEQTDGNFESVFGHYSIDLDNSWGLAARIGFDDALSNSWGLTALAWWIDVDTKATVKSPTGVGLGVQSLQVDVQIDPVVYQLGFYRKF